MKPFIFGKSALGIPVMAYNFGSEGPRVLLMGGVHGDEPEGVALAANLLAQFQQKYDYKIRMTVVPVFNPDGQILHKRTNGHGVDLNRNMPTKDWTQEARAERYFPGPAAGSEPESQAFAKFLKENKPDLIISLHSWEPMLNTNGDCKGEAEVISKFTKYKITDDIGYPTPGSHGTYCGYENNIPTLTYEIQRDLPLDKVIEEHTEPILEALRWTEAHR